MVLIDVPSSIGWLTVTAEGVSALADTIDAGTTPDSTPMLGTVEMRPSVSTPIVAIAETPAKFISMAIIRCEFDENGVLRPPSDGSGDAPVIDPAGNLRIVAPDQPASLSVFGWKWTATFKPSTGQKWQAFTVVFGGAPGDSINLADAYAAQIASTGGAFSPMIHTVAGPFVPGTDPLPDGIKPGMYVLDESSGIMYLVGNDFAPVFFANLSGPEGPAGPNTIPTQAAITNYVDADPDGKLSAKYAQRPDPALRTWFAALGNRYTAPAKILIMGDSNSEGTGSTSFKKRWQALLQANLRQRFPVAGVTGADIAYVSVSPRSTPALANNPVAITGTAPADSSFGLGLRAAQIDSSTTITLTFTGTRVILLCSRSGSTGRFQITLDGGSPITSDSWGGSGAPTTSGNPLWDSGALTAGAHTVAITRAASTTITPGYIYPEGFQVFNGDYSSGIRVIDGARHGAQVGTFSDSTNWQRAAMNIGGLSLAVMAWGANDANAAVPVATFKTKLLDLIEDLRGAGFAGSVLLVGMPKRSELSDGLWVTYLDAMREIAAADGKVVFLDLRSRIPDAGTAEAVALDLYADTVHFKPGAQGWIADEITYAITPR